MALILPISPTSPDPVLIQKAADCIVQGGLVAFPTETVYGLGANAFNPSAVAKIFAAKKRPADNPLIVHIADYDHLALVAASFPPLAKKLAAAFWPGPLTLVLKKKPAIPEIVSAGLSTVAVRMPRHPIAHALLQAAKVPIAAPSANLSTKPSPTHAKHVIDDLYDAADVIIDGGPVDLGLESTVVDVLHQPPLLLRPGTITFEQLNAILPTLVDGTTVALKGPVRSPGMKYKHYAPRAKVIVIEGAQDAVAKKISELLITYKQQGHRVGILSTSNIMHDSDFTYFLGTRPREIAKRLFAAFRAMDEKNITIILSESLPDEGLGRSVKNRLLKAAEEVIKV